MKKLVSLVLALTMLLSVVAFAHAEDKVEIRLTRALFNLATPDTDQVKKVEDAINAYLAELGKNYVVRITEYGSGEYTDKANLALANNEIDLLWTASWEAVIGTNDLVPKNAVKDITDLLPGTALYGSMAEGQWEATKYNGRNYFIPVYKDNVEGYDIMFRKDLVDEFGWDITSVKTLADLEPMLADAASKGLKYPFLTQKTAMFYRWYIGSFDFFTADANTNFFAVSRETGEVVDTILTPEYAEFCKLMGDWAEKGYISEDEANKVTTDTTTQSKDWAISWWTDIPVNAEANSRYGQEVVMQPIAPRYAHSTSALGSCYCITANATDEVAAAAIDFMGVLYTDSKLADMYTFGIEGEDFEYTQEEGQAIKHVTQHSDKYNHSMWESASATVVTPLNNEPDNKADLYVDFNGGAETSIAAGFRFDKTPVEAAYTACANLFEQYGFQLENGAIAPDAVDAYIEQYQAELDAAGYQDVLAEFTRQFNEWKAAQ
jgi:putative aldouronate transport system substrate-binding protein